MRGIIRIEDRDGEIIAVDDLDRTDDKRVFGREKLVPTLVARTHLIKNAVRDEPVEDLAERGDRGQGLRAVPAGINDLQ